MMRKPVKQATLLKISLLLALLMSIPRNLHIYHMVSEGHWDVSENWIGDFLFRLLFLFVFSWVILQLNANWAYTDIKWTPWQRYIGLVVLDIAFLVIFLKFWEFVHANIVATPISREDKGYLNFRYGILLLVLFFIARILRLQREQQESLLENERLKQQNLQNELAALKNQIDPHFLFNSLNSLTSLVRDNERALTFVKKLSFMYRYILQSGDNDLVTLSDELKFLDSYSYLIKTRYRDRFRMEINIDPKLLSETIPPLSLQLLVENAVKHNEISTTHPLTVHIFSKGYSIYVENTVRPRTVLSDNTGYGLSNLDKRFILLKRNKIDIQHGDELFSVELPLRKSA